MSFERGLLTSRQCFPKSELCFLLRGTLKKRVRSVADTFDQYFEYIWFGEI
jgi:hypothetical protein